MTVLIMGLALIIGFEANDMRRRALARRGYSEEGPFLGANLFDAETKYFQPRHAVSGPAAMPEV